jgi:hypothetical protein
MATPTQANRKDNKLYIELITGLHTVYTCGDYVRGVVRVQPTLRPQQISICFKGFSIIHDQKRSNETTPTFFQFSQKLFESSGAHENFDILQRGTARDGKVELPFEFTFPHTVSLAPPMDRTWSYSQDSFDHPRFQHSPGFVLPPTCTILASVNGPSYVLETCMDSKMPDISHLKVRQELRFMPPAPEYDLSLLQPNPGLGTRLPKQTCRHKFIRTRKLLPGYQDSSTLGKIKDRLVEKELFFGLRSFSEVPFAKFSLLAIPARILVLGSNVPIVLSVQHLDRSASLPDPPKLYMRRVRVQLLSTFSVFIPPLAAGLPKEHVETTLEIITLFDWKSKDWEGDPLVNGFSLQSLGDIKLAHDQLLPSFTSYGLALEHELQVEVWGRCADSDFSGICCREHVQVVSDWHIASLQSRLAASSPSLLEVEPRPAIQDADLLSDANEFESRREFELVSDVPAYDSIFPPTTQHFDARPTLQQQGIRPMPPPYMA